ncbi:hypothetical protein D3C74_369120 [compost metagenome]
MIPPYLGVQKLDGSFTGNDFLTKLSDCVHHIIHIKPRFGCIQESRISLRQVDVFAIIGPKRAPVSQLVHMPTVKRQSLERLEFLVDQVVLPLLIRGIIHINIACPFFRKRVFILLGVRWILV